MVVLSMLVPLCAYAGEKTLIMYYSKTGKTRIVAEELKALIPDARLVEVKSDVGMMKAVFWHQLFS
jgi:menaquinone-dependent protoporphyrinogen IX oxidase